MNSAHHFLLPLNKFVTRLTRALGLGLLFISLALMVGMLGYHTFEHMSWTDAFANAAMILSGMGPLSALTTTAGKIFAGCYALFSGLFFILVTALIFAPILHRFFKKMNLEDEQHFQQ